MTNVSKFFLKYKLIRYLLVLSRLFVFVFIFKKLHSIKESKKSISSTRDRNLKSLLSLRDCYDGSRSEFFLKNLEKINSEKKINKSKVLIIGPRNEGEIFNFYAKGFSKKNITAIDLITYSKKVLAYDASMYLKNTKKKFDFIYFGFVINYFKNPKKILSYARNCLNNNGHIIVCSEVSRKIKDTRKVEKTIKFQNLKNINKIFPKYLKNVYETIYTEKLYFFRPLFIKCFIIIKKKGI